MLLPPKLLDKESLMSYTTALPATGVDLLLVGRSDLCRPLAESMLRVTFDRTNYISSDGRRRDRNGGSDGSKKRKRQGTNVGSSANVVHSSGNSSSSISATSSRKDSAVEALRRHLKGNSSNGVYNSSGTDAVGTFGLADAVRARHVRLVDSLSDLNVTASPEQATSDANNNDVAIDCTSRPCGGQYPRADHIVLVVTPADPMSSWRLRKAASSLHPDYSIGGRVTIVNVTECSDSTAGYGPTKVVACADLGRLLDTVERNGGIGSISGGPRSGSTVKRRRSSSFQEGSCLFPAPVPVLQCRLKDEHSRLAIARMLLQRVKMGSRGCWGANDGMNLLEPVEQGGVDNAGLLDVEDVTGVVQTARGGISPLFFASIL